MQNTKLYQLLSVFEKNDVEELKKIVVSPFFNTRSHVSALYICLIEHIRSRKALPTKQEIFAQLFPNREYDDHKLRLSISLLNKLAEQYILLKRRKENKIEDNIYLARYYRNIGLQRHFMRTIKVAEKENESQPFRNPEYFYRNYQIQQEHYRFNATNERLAPLNLQKVSDSTDFAFITIKLRQACFSHSHIRIFKTEYNLGLLPYILQFVEEKKLWSEPAIAVYYYCFQMLTHDDRSYFDNFKTNILQYGSFFPEQEIRDLYILAINFCIRKLNAGDKIFAVESLNLYKSGIDKGLLLTNGYLSRFTYNNIVALSLTLGEYSWAEKFIYDYKNVIEENHRESTYSFNQARIAYQLNRYDEAISLLQKAEYKDTLLNLSAKTVLLKIYFELEELDALESHLGAMRAFIRRKKELAYHQENYLNLIKYTWKLLDVPKYDKVRRQRLAKRIEKTKAVAEREWLLRIASTG